MGLMAGCSNQSTPSHNYYNKEHVVDNKFYDIDNELQDNLNEIVFKVEEERKPKYREEYVIVTYYTASDDECGKEDGITASGTVATEGRTIASDHLEFGTIVEIDGVQYIVEDRFGGNYNNKIDVFVNDKHTAYKLGKRKVKVKIYERK